MSDLKDGLVIDAGHGGSDSGCIGNGLLEKNLTLEAAIYQYKRFQQLGIPVKMTRTTDKTLTPNERVKVINNFGMKHCMSNHINAGGGTGCEVIHSRSSNAKWAQLVAKELVALGQSLRRVFSRQGSSGKDYYFLHRETKCETIIVEYGFIDDRTGNDVAELKTKYIDYVEGVVKAYCEYAGYKYVAPNGKYVEQAINSAADNVLPDGVFKKNDDYNASVKTIQSYLNYWLPAGKKIDADGYYGPSTVEAVTLFQANAHIKSDGIYGSDTKKALLDFYSNMIADTKKDKTDASKGVLYKVQTGAFSKLENATLLQNRLKKEGYDSIIVKESK